MMSKIMKKMKSPNRECLGLIILFLRELCSFQKVNTMTAEKLANSFWVNLVADDEAFQKSLLTGIIKTLISSEIGVYMPTVRNIMYCTRYEKLG